MNFSNPSVMSKKIQQNNSVATTKSFAASFGVHAAVLAAAAYVTASSPIIRPSEERVVISLNEYTQSDGNIRRLETSTAAKRAEQTPKKTPPAGSHSIRPITPEPVRETSEASPVPAAPHLPEASAPLASLPMPASSPSAKRIDSPHPTLSAPVHELPKPPAQGNDISGAALGHIRAMIEKAVVYPSIARKLRLEGVVTVFFILNSDGTVDNAKISSTSGSKLLDEKALHTILSLSGDYPALGKTVELNIPIAFNLSYSKI